MSVEGLRVVDGFNLPEEYASITAAWRSGNGLPRQRSSSATLFLRNRQLAGSARSSAGTALQALGIDVGGLPRGETASRSVSPLCAVRNRVACDMVGEFSPRSRCAGFHQCKWRVQVASTSDWRRKKHPCLGNGCEHIPDRRHFSLRREVNREIWSCRGVAQSSGLCSPIRLETG